MEEATKDVVRIEVKNELIEEVKEEDQNETVKLEPFEKLKPLWTSEEVMSGLKEECQAKDNILGDLVYTELLTPSNQVPVMTNEIEKQGFECVGKRTECEVPTCDVILGSKSNTEGLNFEQKLNLCNTCNKTYSTKKGLRRHILSVHEKLKPYKCASCDYASDDSSKLRNHVNSVHGNLRPFKCINCDSTFSSRTDLSRHIKAVHEKLKPFVCPSCGYAFSQKGALSFHMKSVHLKVKPFKCTSCESAFPSKSTLSKHIKSVHEKLKPYKCSECDHESSSKYHLGNHIKMIHLKLNPLNLG